MNKKEHYDEKKDMEKVITQKDIEEMPKMDFKFSNDMLTKYPVWESLKQEDITCFNRFPKED